MRLMSLPDQGLTPEPLVESLRLLRRYKHASSTPQATHRLVGNGGGGGEWGGGGGGGGWVGEW